MDNESSDNSGSSSTRLDTEWVTLNAVRELISLATAGNPTKTTYEKALELGGKICPDILGASSLIREAHVSPTVREFTQRAKLESKKSGVTITPLALINSQINHETELLSIADQGEATDRIRQHVRRLEAAKIELTPVTMSENQIINRDVNLFDQELSAINAGPGFADYSLLDDHVLRIRALHPDKAEEITGADLIYERHQPQLKQVELVMIQYKIWQGKRLYMNDDRMSAQIARMREMTCKNNLCQPAHGQNRFRFPFCCAFLRPTDRLQSADQRLRTSGEHIPICELERLKSAGQRGADLLRIEDVKQLSLSHIEFESLFRSGKLGSRILSYNELSNLYKDIPTLGTTTTVVIHAQSLELPSDLHDSW